MQLYLQHIESGKFSDAANYPDGIPFEAPDGFQWVEGMPAVDDQPYRQLSFSDQLNQLFEQGLPPEQQADLAPLKAAVKLELDLNRLDIARLIIQRAVIPAELEVLRQQMLLLFPET